MKKAMSLLLALLLVMSCAACVSAEEKPTISILVPAPSQVQPMNEMSMFNDAADAAGVNIEWTEVRSGWDERKAVTLASNNLPDIFMGALLDSDVLSNLDAFVDMTDLIAEYAPNIQAMYEELPEARVAGTYDGGIYSLPLITAFQPHSYTTLSINKSWLDNLGLEVPETLDEFEACLIAFRDQDANGNGDPSDEIPLDWPPQHAHDIYALTGAYGVVDNQSDDMIVLQDGKVSFLYETEAFKELTIRVARWYAEGLITPEVFTNDYTASNALCAQGDVARVGSSTGWSPESRFGQFSDQYIVLPQLIADDPDVRLWPCGNTGVNIMKNAIVLTKQCADPVAAIKLIDQFYTPDFSVQSYYGSFDTGMTTKYDDGTYSIQLVDGYDSIDEAKYFFSLVNNGVGYYSPALQAKTKAPEELTDRLVHDDVNAAFRPVDSDIWPTLAEFTSEQNEELVYLKSDILSMVNQKTAQWIVNGGIEEEWDGFLNNLQNMGIEDMRAIYQSVYDNYMANMDD